MKKKNILIAVLILVIVILISYICYDKFYLDKRLLNDNNIVENNNSIDNNDNNSIYNVDDYVSISSVELNDENKKIKKVSFNNIDNNLVEEFLLKQDDFIEQAKNNEGESKSDIWYQMNGNILSVYYKLSIYTYFCLDFSSQIVVINIDLSNMKVLSNNVLLKLGNVSLNDIAIESYNRILSDVERCANSDCIIVDKEMSKIELDNYKNNKNEIINIIERGVDSRVYSYIQDGVIKYDYIPMYIDALYVNVKSGCPNFVTVSVGIFK